MMYMIAGILIFKGILTDSRAAAAISQELIRMHIPLVLIAVMLPLLVGMSGGIVIAFVGSALPILVPLIQSSGRSPVSAGLCHADPGQRLYRVMLSPMHLCFLLSNEYFGVTWDPSTGISGGLAFPWSPPAWPIFGFCTGCGAFRCSAVDGGTWLDSFVRMSFGQTIRIFVGLSIVLKTHRRSMPPVPTMSQKGF